MIPNNRIEIDRSQKWICSKLRWDKNKFEVKDEIWSTIHSNGYQSCHECRNEENSVPSWKWILALFFWIPDGCLWFRKRTSITPTVIPTVAFCCSFNSFDIFPKVSLYNIYTGVFLSSLFYCEWLLLFYTVGWLINIGWMFTKTFSMLHFRLEWQENQNVNAKKWKIPWGIFAVATGFRDILLHTRMLLTAFANSFFDEPNQKDRGDAENFLSFCREFCMDVTFFGNGMHDCASKFGSERLSGSPSKPVVPRRVTS